jgi:hypothetical protein
VGHGNPKRNFSRSIATLTDTGRISVGAVENLDQSQESEGARRHSCHRRVWLAYFLAGKLFQIIEQFISLLEVRHVSIHEAVIYLARFIGQPFLS